MIDATAIGKRLVDLRGEKSRQTVAKDLKISVSALQMYENGKRIPRDEVKVRIKLLFSASEFSLKLSGSRKDNSLLSRAALTIVAVASDTFICEYLPS